MLNEAIKFAMEAHRNQCRKYDGTPFIRHPLNVMGMVSAYTSDVFALSAAVLHDTIEDCHDVTLDVIHERFGEVVASHVFYVTEISTHNDGNRPVRKELDRIHYIKGSYFSQTIKVCDIIDNIPSLSMYDRIFGLTYINEKVNLLKSLTKADVKARILASKVIKSTLDALY